MLEKPPNKRIYNFRFHSGKNRLPLLFRPLECLVKLFNSDITFILFISFYFYLNFSIKSLFLAAKSPNPIQSYKRMIFEGTHLKGRRHSVANIDHCRMCFLDNIITTNKSAARAKLGDTSRLLLYIHLKETWHHNKGALTSR